MKIKLGFIGRDLSSCIIQHMFLLPCVAFRPNGQKEKFPAKTLTGDFFPFSSFGNTLFLRGKDFRYLLVYIGYFYPYVIE
jgi:hypothetical protein